MQRALSSSSFTDSFRQEGRSRFFSLRKLCKPLLILISTWLALTLSVYFISLRTDVLLHNFLLVGSILSLIGGAFILFAGYMSSATHRMTFGLIYALTSCYMMFAAKMFLTAVIAVSGHDLTWQEKHTSWCYTMALWGQIFFMTSLGYTAVVIFDILFILAYPLFYNRQKENFRRVYHILVWLLSICSCIPAIAAGAIGLNAHGTCWFKGDYGWSAWSFDVLFALFAIGAIAYLIISLFLGQHSDTNAATASVLHQSILIAIAFILSWVWNFSFHGLIIMGESVPHWLNAVQIFWLGGVGFNNFLIWFPFIRKAVYRAQLAAVSGVRRLRHPKIQYVNSASTRYTPRGTESTIQTVGTQDSPERQISQSIRSNGAVRLELPEIRDIELV